MSIYDAQKHHPGKIRFPKSSVRNALFENKLIYTISPQLFQRPDYLNDNAQVLGCHERDKMMDWKFGDELLRFLERNSKIVFITFRGMVNSFPEDISIMVYQVLDDMEIATIVNTAAGGLLSIHEFRTKENFYFLEQIPYNWILSRVYAIVHHGGSGTTHSALKYGCPTLIIPHIIDQFGWNDLIYEIGAGPRGVSINKLNTNKFKELVSDLLENEAYKRTADRIATEMRKENLEKKLYDFIVER